MASTKYSRAYAKLGEERVQVIDRELMVDNRTNVQILRDAKAGRKFHAATSYWATRIDENWSKMPGYNWVDRRTKLPKFTSFIPRILVQLEPVNTFNPLEVWQQELARMEEEEDRSNDEGVGGAGGAGVTTTAGGGKAVKMRTIDRQRAENSAKKARERFVDEVTRIRNSKNKLLDILKEIKIPDARAILIVQILKNAYDTYKSSGDKKLLFETMWAIDSNTSYSIPTTDAPMTKNKKAILVQDPSLVYDSYAAVEKLLNKARSVMSKEADKIKLQLVEMSDTLPPLTRFTFGLRLDPWQKRVLAWIDAGKSVVICAPTSSGKTVLSSYVAIIFKSLQRQQQQQQLEGATGDDATAAAEAAAVAAVAAAAAQAQEEEAAMMAAMEAAAAGGGGGDEGDEGDEGGNWEDAGGAYDEGEDGEEEEEEEEEEGGDDVDVDGNNNVDDLAAALGGEAEQHNLTRRLVSIDRANRRAFHANKAALERGMVAGQRVLFVVPTEPLVWQVAAYFTKLLRKEGDVDTKVGLVTDHLSYYPPKKFNVMPQIIVGTPFALETALTKPRGLVGKLETAKRAQGDLLPGGFDHFDWAIYDEVHSLDGNEGAALQRLIRCMNCKFLALSATVGNAEDLRGWMERTKGDYILGLESITVPAEESVLLHPPPPPLEESNQKGTVSGGKEEEPSFRVKVVKTLTESEQLVLTGVKSSDTLFAFRERLAAEWPQLVDPAAQNAKHTRNVFQLMWRGSDLAEEVTPAVAAGEGRTLGSFGLFVAADGVACEEETIYVNSYVNLLQHQGRFINLQRYVWHQLPAPAPAPSPDLAAAATGGKKKTQSSKKQAVEQEVISKGVLQVASPLLAIESVESLQNGVLDNSSLSFTSRDSYRLWEEISRIYPADSPSVQRLSPYGFFGADERITLQRTKDYEDLLKGGLRQLAQEFPVETREMLCSFQLADPSKDFDLCELVLELKRRDMLPCLPFHLNSFEAIRLFQHLLAGIEWRQKRDHPTYYLDKKAELTAGKRAQEARIKATGKNDKAIDEAAQAGDIDLDQNFEVNEFDPHPNYTFTKGSPLTSLEFTELIDEMEKNDGFERRDWQAMSKLKGQNISILKHALIRGLRRGIGLFIDEVAFPSYRRTVQRLASTGALAVVISDDSLAFGVNMPFRTCVFCGEMFGLLDELMAQQMSGRAGRRGLDTQGNLVYAGMRINHIRRLMIGTVSNITGVNHNPRYESLFLQPVLSSRHVGWNRAEVIGGKTLYEHVHHLPVPDEHFTIETSKQAMLDLQLVSEVVDDATGQVTYRPFDGRWHTHGLQAITWNLRDRMHESVSVGMLFPQLMEELNEMVRDISFNEKKQKADKVEVFVQKFFVVFSLLIGRVPYATAAATAERFPAAAQAGAGAGADQVHVEAMRLQDLQFFSHPAHREFLEEWMCRYQQMQANIPERWAQSLRDPVNPDTDIDGTFLQCIFDRSYVHTLGDARKQEIKEQIWRAGNVLRTFKNCSWPEESYNRVAFFIFRTAFEKVKYLNSELVRGKIDFEDVSSIDREKRTDTDILIPRPAEAHLWFDNSVSENASLELNSFCTAMERCAIRMQVAGSLDAADTSKCVSGFTSSLQGAGKVAAGGGASSTIAIPGDVALARLLVNFNIKDGTKHFTEVSTAVAGCSWGKGNPQRTIGALVWLLLQSSAGVAHPTASSKLFAAYMKTLYEAQYLSEDDIRQWFNDSYDALIGDIPSSYGGQRSDGGAAQQVPTAANPISVADVTKLKQSLEIFIAWLDEDEEEDDDDDDDDDDEEEED
eukprot:CAMPEP_0174983034 /NCGR_PEP_ID=MMETSP0004_2-20121128/16887_1 /TAXON_ID=420556 /ORGANISM="Ochromonas sp., Strain CCMP1393" /LENGTH=1782 /DNA_ID=CAMNT_0016235177 /DNA_START=1 /DNA_END=5349 /DNA_ORIENTATION=+